MREIHLPRFYRLKVKPPFTVSFPSVIYEVLIRPITGAPQWHLRAVAMDGSADWGICHNGEKVEWLERDLYETGFELMHPSVPSAILERLCVQGRAERIERRRIVR